jgi:catechol 2,3-dioxygenase-like lactoylglutathione lyase family enzyme
MTIAARYAHINLIARDWRKLAEFYCQTLGCVPAPPERDLSGAWLDEATGLTGAHIRGMHLRLPGAECGDSGPTLEIFQYADGPEHPAPAVNRPGYGHIAFVVDDVQAARQAVLAAGRYRHALGQVVTRAIPGAGAITFVYVTDPEGNVIELQKWSK